ERRVDAAALLRARVALGEGLRPRRGGPAVALGGLRHADGARGVAGPAGIVRRPARGAGRGGAPRGQPALCLVPAGGALLRAPRAAGGALAAVPRPPRVRLVGGDGGAGPAHPLLRGVPAGSRGGLAAVVGTRAGGGVGGGRRERRRRRAHPARRPP